MRRNNKSMNRRKKKALSGKISEKKRLMVINICSSGHSGSCREHRSGRTESDYKHTRQRTAMHINTPRYAWLPDDAPGYLSLLTPARDEDDTLVFFSPTFTRRLHSLRRRSRGIDINFSIRRRCTSAALMHVSLHGDDSNLHPLTPHASTSSVSSTQRRG